MSATLYLLRQHPDLSSPSLFRVSDADIDIVFVGHATSIAPSFVKGVMVIAEGMEAGGSHPTLTYDDLVEKIFSSEHVIVL
jgi:hypothetical protein